MSTKAKLALAGAAVLLALAVGLLWPERAQEESETAGSRELRREQLELLDQVLYVEGEDEPFDGVLVDYFSNGTKQLSVEVRSGKPHGLSQGWYENGQLEVKEHFVKGVSHGPRTRWHNNGTKKSEAEIVDGQVEGTFTRWHANGTKSAEAKMLHGVPHGVSQAWYASGTLKSRVVMNKGELVEREFFDEAGASRSPKTGS